METALAHNVSLRGQVGRFVLHYFEMCIPMCIGFAVGDLVYFSAAGLLGYSEPFAELPVLSVVVVTFAMTVPMTAWMLYRGMPRRAIWEMSATMPILAFSLLMLGWLGVVPVGDLALLMHGLMMPVMLVPMLLRPGLYANHMHHAEPSSGQSDSELLRLRRLRRQNSRCWQAPRVRRRGAMRATRARDRAAHRLAGASTSGGARRWRDVTRRRSRLIR